MSKSSGAPAARPLSKQEKRLLETQERSLAQAIEVAESEFNLSAEDRTYFEQIFRGELDPTNIEVRRELETRLSDPRYKDTPLEMLQQEVMHDLDKSVDQLLFDKVRQSDSRTSALLGEWEAGARELGTAYTDQLAGLSEGFKQQITGISESMGTADQDIYAQTKAQNLAGISQAFKEAQDTALSALSRRGLAGSGVEAGAISSLAAQEAQMKAGALGQSYQQAVTASDVRRQQQAGIASQLLQTEAGMAGQIYGTQSGLDTAALQAQLSGQQQGIANLQLASGVSQGVYGGAANYLQMAGQTFGQVGQTAGSTAVGLGSNATQYATAKMSADAQAEAGFYGAVGTLAGGVLPFLAPTGGK